MLIINGSVMTIVKIGKKYESSATTGPHQGVPHIALAHLCIPTTWSVC